MVGENTTNNNNIQNETGDLTAVQIGVWDQETVHKGNMVGYHNTEVWDQNTVHKGDTAGYLNTDMKDKAGALTAVHNSSMVGKHTTASNNKKVVDQTSVHKGNKEGDHTAVHIKVDVESAEVKCVKYVNAEGDSVKTKNNKMGDKVEDKHTVYKDKVGDLNTVHINKEGGHALKSQLPEVEGGTLHGATLDGGEASHEKLTSFEVLHEVRGGHALTGARLDDGGHQGSSHPHHPDGGHMPTKGKKTVPVRAEEQCAVMNTYERSTVVPYYMKTAGGKLYKTNRKKKLPRHRALKPSRCPEDWMGEVIVEYPVVFPSSNPTRYGSSTR